MPRISTKFCIAIIALLVSSVGLFAGQLDGGTWVAALSLILGIYGAADVVQNKLGLAPAINLNDRSSHDL